MHDYKIWFKITFKPPEHECIVLTYSRNLIISGIFWTCYTKNNFPVILPKYKKPHFLTSIEISKFTFQIKPVWFKTRNFLMRLKELWNCISRIICVWSLLCSLRVSASLHFLPVLLENYFFVFLHFLPCVKFDVTFINFITSAKSSFV